MSAKKVAILACAVIIAATAILFTYVLIRERNLNVHLFSGHQVGSKKHKEWIQNFKTNWLIFFLSEVEEKNGMLEKRLIYSPITTSGCYYTILTFSHFMEVLPGLDSEEWTIGVLEAVGSRRRKLRNPPTSFLAFGTSTHFFFPEVNEKMEFWCGKKNGEQVLLIKRKMIDYGVWKGSRNLTRKRYIETMHPKLIALADIIGK